MYVFLMSMCSPHAGSLAKQQSPSGNSRPFFSFRWNRYVLLRTAPAVPTVESLEEVLRLHILRKVPFKDDPMLMTCTMVLSIIVPDKNTGTVGSRFQRGVSTSLEPELSSNGNGGFVSVAFSVRKFALLNQFYR